MDRLHLIERHNGLAGLARGNLGAPLLVLGMMMLPPFLLDVLFSFRLELAIVALLVAVHALSAFDFAVFPSIPPVCSGAAGRAGRR